AGKKSAQIREILISESAWEEMTCLFAPSLASRADRAVYPLSLSSAFPKSERFLGPWQYDEGFVRL
ncbi:TPA: hypothetical protein ACWW93_004827, partial [Klebsiella pneumoniae]